MKLDIDIGEKVISQDFKLSGYYETDQNLAMSGLAFVSEAFTQKNISHIDPDISEATGSYVNTAGLGVMFNNSYNIEQKVQKIFDGHRYGCTLWCQSGLYKCFSLR